MPLLRRKRVLAAKVEGTIGSPEALTATEAAVNVFDPKIVPTIEAEEREGQGGYDSLPSVPGPRSGELTFSTEVLPGTAPNPFWATVFLPGCGVVGAANVFRPKSLAPGTSGASPRTLTMAIYEDGLKKAICGAMGNAVFVFRAGRVVRVEFRFIGAWVEPIDAPILEPTYPSAAPLRWASSATTFTDGSAIWAPKIAEMRLDLGNEVVLREDEAKGSGYLGAIITGRKPRLTLNPEASLRVDADPHWDWLQRVEQAMSVPLGSGAGGQVTFAAPKFQFMNVVEGDRAGIQTDEITAQLNRSASAGDDALTITFA